MSMKYDKNNVTPKIEFIEVRDEGLMRYWPKGVTRIVLEVKNPKLKGKNQVVIAEM